MFGELPTADQRAGSLSRVCPEPFTGYGPAKEDYVIDWYLTWYCNYCCFYCSAQTNIPDRNIPRLERERERKPPVDRLIEIFARLPNHWRLHISGGEPFTYGDIIALLTGLLQQRKVTVITNLSLRINELIESVPRENLQISATWHPIPAHGDIEGFIERLRRLSAAGFKVSKNINYVLHPLQLAQAREYKERLLEAGFNLAAKVFVGEYEGRRYPEAYTPEEGKVVDEFGYNLLDRWPRPFPTKGKMCLAGYHSLCVRPEGLILRCEDDDVVMGDFYKGDFPVYSEARPCDVRRGGCYCRASVTRGFVEGIDPKGLTPPSQQALEKVHYRREAECYREEAERYRQELERVVSSTAYRFGTFFSKKIAWLKRLLR